MGFFELITENLFLVIIIVSAIVSMFSKNKQEQKQQENKKKQQTQSKRTQPRPKPVQSRTEPRSTERTRKPVKRQTIRRDAATDYDELEAGSSASIAAEQQAQMENLERRYGIASSNISANDLAQNNLDLGETLKPLDVLSEEQEKLKRNLRSNLKNKGLINGIIMAEVLGKPRSLNPFQSPTLDRYKKH